MPPPAERGLRIHGATLTPFEDTTIAGYCTAESEATCQAVNRWIRTGGEWDGVIVRHGERAALVGAPN